MSVSIDELADQIADLQTTLERIETAITNLVSRKVYNNWLAVKDKEIRELKARITEMETLINGS